MGGAHCVCIDHGQDARAIPFRLAAKRRWLPCVESASSRRPLCTCLQPGARSQPSEPLREPEGWHPAFAGLTACDFTPPSISIVQLRAENRDRLAADQDALALNAHAHRAAPLGRLIRAHLGLPQAFAPEGPRVQCAEPVTGSSSIPAAGAKKRERKSYCDPAPEQVTMTPRS